jgi:hypothetical protein
MAANFLAGVVIRGTDFGGIGYCFSHLTDVAKLFLADAAARAKRFFLLLGSLCYLAPF